MKRNPYEPICELLEAAIIDEQNGIKLYKEFKKQAERAGLVTLAQHIRLIIQDEEDHEDLMLAFRKVLCENKK